jgi:hypothetical protein
LASSPRATPKVREPDLDERGPQAGLHRAQRDAVVLGDLARGHTSEIRTQDQAAFGVGQRGDRAKGRIPLEQEVFVDGLGRFGHLVHEHELRPGHARFASEPVDRLVVGDRHQPRRQAPPMRVEPGGLAPRGHEDVLGELFGGLAGARQAKAHGVDGSREARVERTDRGIVTGEQPFHELCFLPREERSVVTSLHSGSFR